MKLVAYERPTKRNQMAFFKHPQNNYGGNPFISVTCLKNTIKSFDKCLQVIFVSL